MVRAIRLTILSGVFSCSLDTAMRGPMPDDKAIVHMSFASKRPHGGKHRSANARAPYVQALAKVKKRADKHKPNIPIRLIETKARITSNCDPLSFAPYNSPACVSPGRPPGTREFDLNMPTDFSLTHAAFSTSHSPGSCADGSSISPLPNETLGAFPPVTSPGSCAVGSVHILSNDPNADGT